MIYREKLADFHLQFEYINKDAIQSNYVNQGLHTRAYITPMTESKGENDETTEKTEKGSELEKQLSYKLEFCWKELRRIEN